MPAAFGLIPRHSALLRVSLSAPVTIPSIISSDNKAFYKNSSRPGDPPKKEELAGFCMPTGKIPMIPGQSEGGDSHLSLPALPRRPALQGGKGPQAASYPALVPGVRCQEGMWPTQASWHVIRPRKLSMWRSEKYVCVWFLASLLIGSVASLGFIPHLENGDNNKICFLGLLQRWNEHVYTYIHVTYMHTTYNKPSKIAMSNRNIMWASM